MTILRIGCVGDLHGALRSLRVVLEHLRAVDVEGTLFTGDFARGRFNADPALGNTASPAELLDVVRPIPTCSSSRETTTTPRSAGACRWMAVRCHG